MLKGSLLPRRSPSCTGLPPGGWFKLTLCLPVFLTLAVGQPWLNALRRERWLRSMWRHEQLSVRMAVANATHHSSQRVTSASTQTEYVAAPVVESAPAMFVSSPVDEAPPVVVESMDEHVAPAPAVSCAAPAPVDQYIAPSPAVTFAAPATVDVYIAPAPAVTFAVPAPVDEYAPVPAVSYAAPSPVDQYIAPAPAVTFAAPRCFRG